MITLNHFVRRNPQVSIEDFREYWLNTHAEQARCLMASMGVGRYIKCETLHDDEVNILLQTMYGTAKDSYDFVDQMIIGDLASFKEALVSPDVQEQLKALHAQTSEMLDNSRSDYWFSIDVPQLFPRHEVKATWQNTHLKTFYVPRRLPHLGLQETQLHWNSCHGGMARQFAQFLPYDKYVQGHRIESSVINQFKTLLGDDFENESSIIGQAEAWLDRRTVPSLQGPEVDRMMAMLVQDIALVVDGATSHIFVAKEHTVFEKAVIKEPIPLLLNAD
jgi:hypothetical protein